jgi:hypothetical protein
MNACMYLSKGTVKIKWSTSQRSYFEDPRRQARSYFEDPRRQARSYFEYPRRQAITNLRN